MTAQRQSATKTAFHIPRPAPSTLDGTRLWNSTLLSHEERQELGKAVVHTRSFRPNTDIICEGDCVDSIFIVTEGWACRSTTTSDGARQLPALLVPGDVANLDSLMFDRLDYGVRTLTQATVVALPLDRALHLATWYPGIARMFTWLAMAENVILSTWVVSLGRRSARDRLAHLLCELSVRLDAAHGTASSFEFPLTQEQLGDALGLTSVHVNRMMHVLRADGLVEIANRTMTLPDVAALRRIGGFDPRYLRVDPRPEARFA